MHFSWSKEPAAETALTIACVEFMLNLQPVRKQFQGLSYSSWPDKCGCLNKESSPMQAVFDRNYAFTTCLQLIDCVWAEGLHRLLSATGNVQNPSAEFSWKHINILPMKNYFYLSALQYCLWSLFCHVLSKCCFKNRFSWISRMSCMSS